MASSTALPTIGALAILATVSGISLGRAAIAEINPVYFQPASSHFYSDLVPNHGSGDAQSDPGGTDYLQADYAYSAAPTCTECGNYPIDTRPLHDAAVDGVDDGWSASAAVLADDPPPTREKQRPDPAPANRAWVERYMDYSVAAEPAVAADDAPKAEPAAYSQTDGTAAAAQDEN